MDENTNPAGDAPVEKKEEEGGENNA